MGEEDSQWAASRTLARECLRDGLGWTEAVERVLATVQDEQTAVKAVAEVYQPREEASVARGSWLLAAGSVLIAAGVVAGWFALGKDQSSLLWAGGVGGILVGLILSAVGWGLRQSRL